jgi:hypothetical protein
MGAIVTYVYLRGLVEYHRKLASSIAGNLLLRNYTRKMGARNHHLVSRGSVISHRWGIVLNFEF